MNTDAILGPRIRQADDPQLPCEEDLANRRTVARITGTRMRPTPYDLLTTPEARGGGGPAAVRATRREALALCSKCPVQAACWGANADEEWVQALTGSVNAVA